MAVHLWLGDGGGTVVVPAQSPLRPAVINDRPYVVPETINSNSVASHRSGALFAIAGANGFNGEP